MKEIYGWVPWFGELAGKIAEGGETYLAEAAKKVKWRNDGKVQPLLRYGDENIDPFSFFYSLAQRSQDAGSGYFRVLRENSTWRDSLRLNRTIRSYSHSRRTTPTCYFTTAVRAIRSCFGICSAEPCGGLTRWLPKISMVHSRSATLGG